MMERYEVYSVLVERVSGISPSAEGELILLLRCFATADVLMYLLATGLAGSYPLCESVMSVCPRLL
jgi:hypothetical protein